MCWLLDKSVKDVWDVDDENKFEEFKECQINIWGEFEDLQNFKINNLQNLFVILQNCIKNNKQSMLEGIANRFAKYNDSTKFMKKFCNQKFEVKKGNKNTNTPAVIATIIHEAAFNCCKKNNWLRPFYQFFDVQMVFITLYSFVCMFFGLLCL